MSEPIVGEWKQAPVYVNVPMKDGTVLRYVLECHVPDVDEVCEDGLAWDVVPAVTSAAVQKALFFRALQAAVADPSCHSSVACAEGEQGTILRTLQQSGAGHEAANGLEELELHLLHHGAYVPAAEADWLAAALADNCTGAHGDRMTKAEWREWGRMNAESEVEATGTAPPATPGPADPVTTVRAEIAKLIREATNCGGYSVDKVVGEAKTITADHLQWALDLLTAPPVPDPAAWVPRAALEKIIAHMIAGHYDGDCPAMFFADVAFQEWPCPQECETRRDMERDCPLTQEECWVTWAVAGQPTATDTIHSRAALERLLAENHPCPGVPGPTNAVELLAALQAMAADYHEVLAAQDADDEDSEPHLVATADELIATALEAAGQPAAPGPAAPPNGLEELELHLLRQGAYVPRAALEWLARRQHKCRRCEFSDDCWDKPDGEDEAWFRKDDENADTCAGRLVRAALAAVSPAAPGPADGTVDGLSEDEMAARYDDASPLGALYETLSAEGDLREPGATDARTYLIEQARLLTQDFVDLMDAGGLNLNIAESTYAACKKWLAGWAGAALADVSLDTAPGGFGELRERPGAEEMLAALEAGGLRSTVMETCGECQTLHMSMPWPYSRTRFEQGGPSEVARALLAQAAPAAKEEADNEG